MDKIGDKIRAMRKEKGLPLRIVASYLDTDPAILSKIETGKRRASREQIVNLAKYFNANENDLLTAWLADKLVYEAGGEKMALEAMKMAEQMVEYRTAKKVTLSSLKRALKIILNKADAVQKVWLFGSYARGEADYKSDIDLVIEVDKNAKFTYFDLVGIQYELEGLTGKKVDIGFYGVMRGNVWERVKNEIKLVYEK